MPLETHRPRPFEMLGRTAVITGASSGIGRHLATVLASAGATVIAVARREDRLRELATEVEAVHPVAADIARPEGRTAVIDAISKHGPVDVLVNNAGVPGEMQAGDETVDGFAHVLDVNLAASFHLAVAVEDVRSPDAPLSIVNVGSIVGLVSTAPIGGASYAASKAGLLGLTRELAGQWGRRGVRVNALVPGWFETEMTAPLFRDEKAISWVTRNTMLARPGQLNELDGPLLFLASPASSYVTGQTVVVDGGWTAR